MRNIKKTADEARRVIESKQILCISAGEMTDFMKRLDGEHPLEVLYDMFLFGFAVGYRAGKRTKA